MIQRMSCFAFRACQFENRGSRAWQVSQHFTLSRGELKVRGLFSSATSWFQKPGAAKKPPVNFVTGGFYIIAYGSRFVAVRQAGGAMLI
jgi:hypothetical protein